MTISRTGQSERVRRCLACRRHISDNWGCGRRTFNSYETVVEQTSVGNSRWRPVDSQWIIRDDRHARSRHVWGSTLLRYTQHLTNDHPLSQFSRQHQHAYIIHNHINVVSITSDKGGGKCVCPRLSVCLSVCLFLARLLKHACMECCVSTDVGTWTNWFIFEPDPDYSPDAGTGLLSPQSYKRWYAALYAGKIRRMRIGRCSDACFYNGFIHWAVETPLSNVHALHRVPF